MAQSTPSYHLLEKYLRERFADRVVLTFGEIEDLIGFPLPAQARQDLGWWSEAVGGTALQSCAWRLASRSASVNLVGQRVTFDRES